MGWSQPRGGPTLLDRVVERLGERVRLATQPRAHRLRARARQLLRARLLRDAAAVELLLLLLLLVAPPLAARRHRLGADALGREHAPRAAHQLVPAAAHPVPAVDVALECGEAAVALHCRLPAVGVAPPLVGPVEAALALAALALALLVLPARGGRGGARGGRCGRGDAQMRARRSGEIAPRGGWRRCPARASPPATRCERRAGGARAEAEGRGLVDWAARALLPAALPLSSRRRPRSPLRHACVSSASTRPSATSLPLVR